MNVRTPLARPELPVTECYVPSPQGSKGHRGPQGGGASLGEGLEGAHIGQRNGLNNVVITAVGVLRGSTSSLARQAWFTSRKTCGYRCCPR
jgi:hypothetical protein